MTSFADKNDRRKRARNQNLRRYAEGRVNRKAFASDGAFGNVSARIYNMCVIGTSALERNDKGGRGSDD